MLDSRAEPQEVADYELLKNPDDPGLPPKRPIGLWIVVALLIAAAGVAAYIVFGTRQAPAPVTAANQREAATQERVPPLGGDAAPIVVPPLDQTDPLVREMVKQITSNPRIAAWLATNGLIRNFAVVTANIADGATPAVHLRTLRPASGFAVTGQGAGLAIDPKSYQRYDAFAAAAASIDPAGAARLYATLKPRIEEAYRDVSDPDARFDRTLERAIVVLLKTPTVPDPILVRPQGGTGYAFADPNLEALTPPQKQLLRTGAANVRTIQSSLRAIAIALGIPPGRLPLA